MTSEFARAARSLVAGAPGATETSAQIAERAFQAGERLLTHLSRLLGESGVRLLLKRAIVLASVNFPWLAAASTSENMSAALRDALALQDPESITEAFVEILVGFVGLLERLIGEPLVGRLLEEVWPTVFTHAAKDTP